VLVDDRDNLDRAAVGGGIELKVHRPHPVRRIRRRHHWCGAGAHTVVLPRFGVDALTALIADTGGLEGPVFVNRDGGWISKANMRRALRATLPDDLAWVTPHSFRRTVATVVRDAHGPAAAQQQLSHAKLRPPRRTISSARPAGQTSEKPSIGTPPGESGDGKYQESIN
jgi:integrase